MIFATSFLRIVRQTGMILCLGLDWRVFYEGFRVYLYCYSGNLVLVSVKMNYGDLELISLEK